MQTKNRLFSKIPMGEDKSFGLESLMPLTHRTKYENELMNSSNSIYKSIECFGLYVS